jgi:ankyrin repeat protein
MSERELSIFNEIVEELFRAWRTDNLELTHSLLGDLVGNGTLNSLNQQGEGVLHEACACNYIGLVSLLLDIGADVNLLQGPPQSLPYDSERMGWSALHIASQESDPEVVQMLLGFGAEVNLENRVRTVPYLLFFSQS